ncbi:unnamed protein product [Microthlaspi erraticum]|uniref:Uncharacterized protein n=1 Tax=Microthlaspi erraticum TaxID=1685480 RepID=A0A6D2JPM3_9BRAS|nr:unnamed protein product [Microthlaspi erraticum]
MTSRYPLKAGTSLPLQGTICLATEIRLAAKIYFAATIPSAKKGREPPSVRTTPLKKIFLERQTPQLEEILLEREDPQTHGESRQADGFESMRST